MQKVLKGHSQTQRIIEFFKRIFLHRDKTVEDQYLRRVIILRDQRLRFCHIRFSRIHRVDAVLPDPRKLLLGDAADHNICHRRFDDRHFILFQELDTLYCGIRPLVILSRQELHAKYLSVCRNV